VSGGRLGWFTALVLYALIWWVTLFAILPLWTRPREDPDTISGWRGAPERPLLGRKLLVTSLVAAFVWFALVLLIRSPFLSFRNGIFSLPID
jgi:predicted secreted protein